METNNAAPDEYVSRAEFNNVCNQLADALEIIKEILSEHANIDSYGVHKLGELDASIKEIQQDQFI